MRVFVVLLCILIIITLSPMQGVTREPTIHSSSAAEASSSLPPTPPSPVHDWHQKISMWKMVALIGAKYRTPKTVSEASKDIVNAFKHGQDAYILVHRGFHDMSEIQKFLQQRYDFSEED